MLITDNRVNTEHKPFVVVTEAAVISVSRFGAHQTLMKFFTPRI